MNDLSARLRDVLSDEMLAHLPLHRDLLRDGLIQLLAPFVSSLLEERERDLKNVTITTGSGDRVIEIPRYDGRLIHATELCRELVGTGNGNVPIQSVYEAMMKPIGREEVIEAMRQDADDALGKMGL